MEDKREILARLLPALQATRAGSDIKDLKYRLNEHDEYCVIVFQDGYLKEISIGCDSGLEIIVAVVCTIGGD